MKTPSISRLTFGLFLMVGPLTMAFATDGTWNSTTSGSWTLASKWAGNTIADGAGSTADFSKVNISGNVNVTLDGDRTIGSLLFGDTNTSSAGGWQLNAGNPSTSILTLDNGANGVPIINVSLASGQFATIGAQISAPFGLKKTGTGSLAFSNTLNSISSIEIAAGAVSVAGHSEALGGASLITFSGSGANAGTFVNVPNAQTSANITVNAGAAGTLSNPGVYSGAISGQGLLTFANSGSSAFLSAITGDNSSFSGTFAVSQGLLDVGSSGTSGNLGLASRVILNTPSSTLVISRSDTYLIDHATLAGVGGLVAGGSGTTVLTTTNLYTGTTTIYATLQVGNGGATGSLGSGIIANSGTLAFNRTDAYTVANVITSGSINSGSLKQIGTGTLTLTGTSTAFTGATEVDAGVLKVNGSLANSAVTINSGGALGGSGTVGALTVNSGGVLSPGNSPGTLSAANTTLIGGGAYFLQMDSSGTGSAGTNWDQLALNGTMDISALDLSHKFIIQLQTLDAANAPGLLPSWNDSQAHLWSSVITTTGGFVGTFASTLFTIDTSAFANTFTGSFSLIQDQSNPNNLDLAYTPTGVPEPSTWAMLALGVGLVAFRASRFWRSKA